MRLVIETTDDERDAIKKLCASLDTTYSALFRALFRHALTGKVKDLRTMLAAPRSELHVKLDMPSPAPPEKPPHERTGEEIMKSLGWGPEPKAKRRR